MKNFADLTEREVLAVAIAAEEEDSRIYMSFAEDLAERYPESAKIFEEMAEEEKYGKEDRWTFGSDGDARGIQRRSGRADAKSRANRRFEGELFRRPVGADPERRGAAASGR